MPQGLNPLIQALNRLRKIDPSTFQECVNDLANYTAEVVIMTVEAPPDAVLEMQGRARQARAFLRAFRECHLAERQSSNRSPSP